MLRTTQIEQLKFATPKDRAVAFVIDLIFITLVVQLSALVILDTGIFDKTDVYLEVFVRVFFLGYFVVGNGPSGQTIGKRIRGIRIIQINGKSPSWKTAFLRTITQPVSALFIAGYLSVLTNESKQAFHDRMAGTYVVDSRGGVNEHG